MLLRQLIIAVEKIENLNEIRHINVALKQSSFTDYLTSLRNRNGLYDSFNKLLGEANCNGVPLDLAVLYIDLDNFKYYNDTFGHGVGDLVLKEVANILNATANESGFAIRYGGDEFLIIGRVEDKDEAEAFKQMLEEELRRQNEVSGLPYPIEASIGYVLTDSKSKDELDDYVKKADELMYEVKKKNRKNRKSFLEN